MPQPLRDLRRRFPEALEDVYDPESCDLGTQAAPALVPKQRFDFATGVRLLCYRYRGCLCPKCDRLRREGRMRCGTDVLVVAGTAYCFHGLNDAVVAHIEAADGGATLRRMRRLFRGHIRLLLPAPARLLLRDKSDDVPCWEVKFESEEAGLPRDGG